MSEREESSGNNSLNSMAYNYLYQLCFKDLTKKQTSDFGGMELNQIDKCHQRLMQAFQIIAPNLKEEEGSE